MLLAGDVGGTKTLLGLFERGDRRPTPVETRSYVTNSFSSFTAILDAFARDVHMPFSVAAAAVGVAGPVVGDTARLTHIVWDITADEIRGRFGIARARLLNDLEAMAHSVTVLAPDELAVLQEGEAVPHGNAAVIAAGTGLGEAGLHQVSGAFWPLSSEAGHSDFAVRSDREIELLLLMRRDHGRAAVEDVLSGRGLLNLHRLTHDGNGCASIRGLDAVAAPAGLTSAGLKGTCPGCVEALAMFVSAYGAEAGNLALRVVAIGGLFVGGGIAPKILPALQDGRFIEAFRDKGPMTELVSRIPVKVILNAEAGLLGAAVYAQHLAQS